MTKKETVDFLKEIVGLYPRFEQSESTVTAWHRRLKDVSVDDAIESLNRYFDRGETYAPSLKQILELLPKAESLKNEWGYEQDQYGFEYVVKNGMRIGIKQIDDDTYEDTEGRKWAIV